MNARTVRSLGLLAFFVLDLSSTACTNNRAESDYVRATAFGKFDIACIQPQPMKAQWNFDAFFVQPMPKGTRGLSFMFNLWFADGRRQISCELPDFAQLAVSPTQVSCEANLIDDEKNEQHGYLDSKSLGKFPLTIVVVEASGPMFPADNPQKGDNIQLRLNFSAKLPDGVVLSSCAADIAATWNTAGLNVRIWPALSRPQGHAVVEKTATTVRPDG